MHRHMKPEEWAFAFGDPGDRNGCQLFGCPRCSAARGDLETWLLSVADCPRCWPAFQTWGPLPPDVLDCEECMAAYREFERLVERVEHYEPLVALEWIAGEGLLREIAGAPPDVQIERVQADAAYQQWGFCQRLLAEASALWTVDLHLARSLSRLAVTVAGLLGAEAYQPEWLADLKAKAHGYLANSLRLLGEYAAAEEEFVRAERWVERGVRHGRAEATVLSLKAALLMDQYRHLEAEALLERVERHFRDHEQAHEAGRTLLQLAMVSRARNLLGVAIRQIEEALTLFDAERDPHLPGVASNNLVLYRIEAGDAAGARAVFDQLPEPQDRLRRIRHTWLEAGLRCVEGDLEGAGRLYDDVRVAYLAEDLHYNVALVSLDLAIVATQQGRTDAVRELARDAVVLLTRSGAPQEAFAAVRLLVDSLERDAVSVAFIQQISRKLARLQPSG